VTDVAFFQVLQTSSLSQLIDSSRYFTIVFQSLHILGFTFAIAAVVLVNIQLYSSNLLRLSTADLLRSINPYYNICVGIALITGVLILLPRAVFYTQNPALQIKVIALSVALSLYWAAQFIYQQKDRRESSKLPWRVTFSLVLLFWLLAGFAGRAIGFL
jgi:hypothetical protein